MAILSRLLLDREIVIDHNLLHMIQDIMSRVIDRVEGNNGDEEVGRLLINHVVPETNAAPCPDDKYIDNHLSLSAGSRSAVATA